LDGVSVALNGNTTRAPNVTTFYHLNATGPGGSATEKEIMVMVEEEDQEYFDTGHDIVPNLASSPNLISVQTGNWNSTSTWNLGRVPTAGDVIKIDNGHTVTVNVQDDNEVTAIGIVGTLKFSAATNTRITAETVQVQPGGRLEIGTSSVPIPQGTTAEIVIVDNPINTSTDSSQWGHGVVGVTGETEMYGAAKTDFLRCTVEPAAGHTTVTLESSPTNWAVGDIILIPDSRQLSGPDVLAHEPNYVNRDELRTITSVSSNVVTFTPALTYAHPGAYYLNDSDVRTIYTYPHVANLTRNIVIRSQNGDSSVTRGHCVFTGHQGIDLAYVEIRDMGRSTIFPYDSTTPAYPASPTHIGTNQRGRYPLHLHHVHTHGGTWHNTIIGCVIRNSVWNRYVSRGCYIVHGTNFTLIQNCIAAWFGGGGFNTEDGDETGTVMDHCFACGASPLGTINPNGRGWQDNWFEATGFWLMSADAVLTDCVSVNCEVGFMPTAGPLNVTIQRPTDTTMNTLISVFCPGEGIQWSGIEAYGGSTNLGMSIWEIGTNAHNPAPNAEPSNVDDFLCWNVHEKAWYNYKVNVMNINNPVWLNDPNKLSGAGYFGADYLMRDSTISGGRIEGFLTGVYDGTQGNNHYFDGIRYKNCLNHLVTTRWGGGGLPRYIYISDCTFRDGDPSSVFPANKYDIFMGPVVQGDATDLILLTQVHVTNFDEVAADDFRVYWDEQLRDVILQQSGNGITASPVAGLTNQQNFDTYGICWAGELPPADVTSRTRIKGKVKAS
jgi:hypothetical protein